MSAIWGVINTDQKSIPVGLHKSMVDSLDIYKLDLINFWDKNNTYLGCGLQYITPESLHEVLPYYDEDKKIALTADAIIDNREELFDLLNISIDARKKITDSELILVSYKKWGKECPKYLVGDFAFVLWDEGNNEVFCARDHVGARTLYYSYSNKMFVFCTVVKPIIAVCDHGMDLNERWISDFLALPGVINQSECEETIYMNIFQLPPAHTLIISNTGIDKVQYWNPLKKIKKLKLNSDRDYFEAFNKVFSEAVKCRLRCNGEVGISLSGGLDSSAVACIAAKTLEKEGKRLKAFSFIPMKDIKYKIPANRIADESEYIESIVNYSGNIDVTYCRCEGKDSFSKMDWFINILEQPYKNIENSFWADELTENASQNGCRIMLSGQYGNATISYGDFMTYIITLLRKGNFPKILKEIDNYSKLYSISKFIVGKAVCKATLPYCFRKLVINLKKRNDKVNKYDWSPINKKLLKRWNIEKRFEKQGYTTIPARYLGIKEVRKLIVNPVAFTQISTFETKISLAYGIMKRDPTKDKRVIEFCLSLPCDQFVRNGEERRLIRRSMKGILPDKIRLNYLTRGLQYADWIQRLEPRRNEICNDIEKVIGNKQLNKYIDVDKFKQELNLLKDESNDINLCNMRLILVTIVLAHFINNN